MFLHNIIQRRLSSLFQPWLQEEPQLDLKLGLINCYAIAENLRFDNSALNQLIDDSACISFKEVTVEHLSVRFSTWSAPAFSIEVRGLHVTLSTREMEEGGSFRRVRNSRDGASREMKKALSAIDPEGCALHDVLERILVTTSSRNRFRTSLLNLILKHCRIQMLSFNLQLKFPILDDSFAYLLEIKDLTAESQDSEQGCLLGGIVGALLLPLNESSFVISGSSFEIGYKRNDGINHVCVSNDLFTCIALNDLQFVDLNLRIRELGFLFSPADLPILTALGKLSSKEFKYSRSGRQLWRLAAGRIGYVISAPRFSFQNLVGLVILWLQYVNAYEHLLSVVGYSSDELLKGSTVKMSQDKMLLNSVKHNWEVISDIEKELPAAAIAHARRIARYRAALNVQHAEDSYRDSFVYSHLQNFCKILSLLVYIWGVMYRIFQSIVHFFFLRKNLIREPEVHKNIRVASQYCCPQFHFILNIGKTLITVYPASTIQPVIKKLERHIGISYSNFLSFCFSVDKLLLMYVADVFEQSVSISCGQVKVKSSKFTGAPSMHISSMKGHKKGRDNNSRTILWGEPAQMVLHSETDKNGATGHGEGARLLEKFLGEMWLSWKRACMKFEESEIEYSENPYVLCDLKSFLTYQDLENPDSGFWKCNLTLGKLNLALGFSSVLSTILLLRQIQYVQCWTADGGRATALSRSPSTKADQRGFSWDDKYGFYTSRMKMALLKMLPEKHIQLGIFIAGPHIQMSLGQGGFGIENKDMSDLIRQDDFHLGFDVHNIEVVVWPTSKSDLAALTVCPRSDDSETEFLGFQELQIIDILKSDNEKYASQGWISLCSYVRVNGLNAFLGDSAENQQSQIFVLKPITLHLSSFREYVYSFSTAVTAFSTALNGLAMGFGAVSFMDELYIFFQVVLGSFSALSNAFNSFDSVGNVPCQEFRRPDMVPVEHENEEISAEGSPLSCSRTLFLINANFKLKSVDIVLHNSRVNNKVESLTKFVDAVSSKQLAGYDLPDCGIWSSVLQTRVDISYEERKFEILIDLSEIQSILFRYQDHIPKFSDYSVLRVLLLKSHNRLYDVFLSNCIFTLWLGHLGDASSSGSVSDTYGGSTSVGNTSHTVENSLMTNEPERSSVQSRSFVQKLGFALNFPTLVSGHWILINVALSEVLIARYSKKNVLVRGHQFTKLLSLLSIGEKFQTISWGIQGGLLLLEPIALVMFTQCFSSYLYYIKNLFLIVQSSAEHIEKVEGDADMNGLNERFITEYAQETLIRSGQVKWELPEAFSLDVSQSALVFVGEDESGGVRQFVLEIDIRMDLELSNMQRKFILELSRLSVLSQVLQDNVESDITIPHFASVTSSELSSRFVSEDSTEAFRRRDGNCSVDDASCSRDPVSQKDSVVKNCVSEVFCLSHQNYVLKHLGVFVSVMKPENHPLHLKQAWVGSGSVSGFDVTISLSELQMILSMVSSFSGLSSREASNQSVQRHWSNNHEIHKSFEAMVPNGSIVAIQDVHQHLYFTVEGGGNKYTLAGVLHYSLVGERALFRVKYHNQGRWKSSVLWFSLISLYAKNNVGEPLRLNYCRGSGFVDISGTYDSAWTLWRTQSCEPESYKGDIDWEPYNQLVRHTFYLVNKKSDCAVAFVDGVPEFVRKPGNQFKLKVFHDLFMVHDVVTSSRYSLDSFATNVDPEACKDEGKTSVPIGNLPGIDISIDEVALTIVHELLETKDRFPLLRGSINNTQLTVQVLSTKARVISTLKASLNYFDAGRNIWREFVHPVELSTFYRSTFQTQGSETVLNRMPVHIYCRTKKLEVSLTELSLDILLFVIGKLSIAGPFSVRNSTILANCCKVENQSGLNLLCHFNNMQSVKIGRRQSASIFLRHSALINRSPETAPVVSIQLSVLGSFTTSSIHLSLLEARALAWRTRIVSVQDSRSYPGPFLVVDILRKAEDDLSIVVSPLIRIHNETEFSMELRFLRPEQKQDEFASVMLNSGDTVDDSMAAFDAISLSGGLKKALTSLSVGNFLFSFRPEIPDDLITSESPILVEWSGELKGGKAVRMSGIFDKLSYGVRRALSIESLKCSFSTLYCALKSEDACMGNIHFLIQTIGRDVPIIQPDKSADGFENGNSPIALQEQKEIFLLPTVRVSNLLDSEIRVLLTETDQCTSTGCDNIGKQATIKCGSTVNFYVNPAMIYFTVTLIAFSSSCKPVNSGDCVKKLLKHKNDLQCLDVDLDFGGGKYYALLRLSRGQRGILEAAVFTSYTLKNDSDFSFFFFAPNKKPLSRDEVGKFGPSIPPELGLLLAPKSTGSWFLRSHKVRVKLFEDCASEALLDLDALSGLAEISLEIEEGSGVKCITKFGLSMRPSPSKVVVPSQTVTMVPRHIVLNESEERIIVRQCYLEDDTAGMISINSKQRTVLQLRDGFRKRIEFSLFENFIRKHRSGDNNSLIFIQFRLNEPKFTWSGPLCITSLGCFFLKFRKQFKEVMEKEKNVTEFASVSVTEEGSTLVVRFNKPPNINLPYRIENCLRGASLTYYQKDSSEPEVLGPECSVDYVWDDLTLPHKLVVLINDMHPLREIRLDKVRPWKPFSKVMQYRGLATHLLEKKSRDQRTNFGDFNNIEMVKVGYEVYADGPTRVLRICEFEDKRKGDTVFHSHAKIQLRVSYFAINLLEHGKQDLIESAVPFYTPILVARLRNIDLDSVFTDQQKYNQICVQSFNVDQKWAGAPFAAMLRRHQSDSSDTNDCLFKFVFVLLSTNSNVKQVKFSSIVLQPVDLKIDEETLMRIVSFWRTSLSDSNSQSSQFYFDHFEIHPIKIIANFLPGDSYSSYNSAQETLRSLLHSVVKVPPIKNMVVELNGVLVTHALITVRELFFRCAQHYSWYAMRAIYIAKGSTLLPPAFASIFDDLASSSLDAFFDPSRGLMNLPGLTLGTFKFISKCIDDKGFSGTRRYFGDMGKTLRTAGSNVLFAAVTEVSDSVLKGAESSGFDGMLSGFHQGILKLAMEPSLLGTALMEGGPDRKIKLDRSPGVDELYIEGYLQAMLDTMYRQEYLRVRVIDDQVFLKNLPPNSSLIDEIMDRVKGFLVSKALLKGDPSSTSRPLHHLRGESEWKIGPTVLTLCEHLFVSYAIRMLRKHAGQFIAKINTKKEAEGDVLKAVVPAKPIGKDQKVKFIWKWGIGNFVLSGMIAYIDGRLCRGIPNPIARRIVSGFLLSFLDKNDS